MSLIAILISLILERSFGHLREYRQFDWFDKYTDKIKTWFDERKWQGPIVVLLIIFGPLLAVIVVNVVLDDVLLGLLSLIFSTVVLFLCLAPQDIEKQLENFLTAWGSEDEDAAKQAAKEILGEEPPEALGELQQRLVERILIIGHDQILSPIIWFTVFALLGSGPLGAVLYRLSSHLQQRFGQQSDSFAQAVNRLYDILGWVPAHLVAVLFAMAGSFVDAMHLWRERRVEWRDDWQKASSLAVITSGLGALQMASLATDESVNKDDVPKHVRAVMGLILRSIVILVVIVAALTLALFGY